MNYCKDCQWFEPLDEAPEVGICSEARGGIEFKASAMYCCHLFKGEELEERT